MHKHSFGGFIHSSVPFSSNPPVLPMPERPPPSSAPTMRPDQVYLALWSLYIFLRLTLGFFQSICDLASGGLGDLMNGMTALQQLYTPLTPDNIADPLQHMVFDRFRHNAPSTDRPFNFVNALMATAPGGLESTTDTFDGEGEL